MYYGNNPRLLGEQRQAMAATPSPVFVSVPPNPAAAVSGGNSVNVLAGPEKGKCTWLGRVVVVVFAITLVWTVVLAVTLAIGYTDYLNFYFGLVFGLAILIFVIPIKHEDADNGKTLCCRKSWRWYWEKLSQSVLLMFVLFVLICVIEVQFMAVPLTNSSYLISSALGISIGLTLVSIFLEWLSTLTSYIAFGALIVVVYTNGLPISTGGQIGLSIGMLVAINLALWMIAKRASTDIHIHVLDGLSITYSIYFLVDGFPKWLTNTAANYGVITGIALGLGLGRCIWDKIIDRWYKHQPPGSGLLTFARFTEPEEEIPLVPFDTSSESSSSSGSDSEPDHGDPRKHPRVRPLRTRHDPYVPNVLQSKLASPRVPRSTPARSPPRSRGTPVPTSSHLH
jgi:hypothetical protein